MDCAFNSNVIQSNNNYEEKYKALIHEYPTLKFRKRKAENMKIKYLNPDDVDKELKVESSNDIVIVRNPTLKINYKSSCYIRLKFLIPETPAFYDCYITIKNMNTNEMEEILKINFEVLNDNEEY